MKPFQVNLFHSIILIVTGTLGYFLSEKPSPTTFIPVAFGVILLLMNAGLKKENKTIAHLVVLLTLLITIALVMPLKGAIGRQESGPILRVSLMLIASVAALGLYIKSFVEARKARNN
jgi:protein-S-isoprenylcysteine O-methyltransferase Ste14